MLWCFAASYIGVPRSHVETTNFADGESSVKIVDPIEQGEVFVVQSTGPPVNENVMELLLIIRCVLWQLDLCA